MGLFQLNSGQNRIFGLDLLRFLAIFFVLVGHSVILLPVPYKADVRTLILDGVSIFFVLSGFLIGRILFKQFERGETRLRDLFRFWYRRWLRTLPAYYVVLTLLLVYTFHFKPERVPEDWYRYYLFIQNMFTPQPDFFQESWSLSIEEWFYLLIPALFFLLIFLFRKRQLEWIFALILAGVCGIFLYRLLLYREYGGAYFEENLLLQVIPRLDGIMMGVLGAFCAVHYPKLFNKLNAWNHFLIMLCVLYLLKRQYSSNESIYYCVFSPSLKSVCVLLMLPFLSQWRLSESSFVSRAVTFVSVTSYSIYLTNRTIVIDIFIKAGLHGNIKGKHTPSAFWWMEYFLFWMLSLIIAFILYKLVEQPFLKLREKF